MGGPDGQPAMAEEAPSSTGSDVGDKGFAQMSKSTSYMDTRLSFHLKWVSQDGNSLRLDRLFMKGGTPKPKVIVVGGRRFPLFPLSIGCGTDRRRFMVPPIETVGAEPLPWRRQANQ